MTADPPEEYKFTGSFHNLNNLLELLSYTANKVSTSVSMFMSTKFKFYAVILIVLFRQFINLFSKFNWKQ
jgi:hypothetical protein